jgi:protein-tyrosine phosphatase
MPRPRGGEWLKEEILALKKQKVELLVSLLEAGEIYELELENEKAFCEEYEVRYLNFPIPDRNIPLNNSPIDHLVEQINNEIKTGNSVAIHCRMGIGRSSIIAGCVLQKLGLKTGQIIELITKARGLKVPDTEEQLKWLRNRE